MISAFGADFSRAFCLGCASIGTRLEWPFAVLCLEGDGMNPYAANASGARGMWQRMPTQVVIDGVPRTLPPGVPPPAGCIARPVKGPDGAVIHQTVWRLYSPTDPVRQINDYFAYTRAMIAELRAGKLTSRSALYCLNLAPARVYGGTYTDETIVYSTNVEDEPLNARGHAFAKTYWPDAYQANARAFGLDPKNPHGRILMSDLATGLDAAVARHQAKYDAELTAAYVANAGGPPDAA